MPLAWDPSVRMRSWAVALVSCVVVSSGSAFELRPIGGFSHGPAGTQASEISTYNAETRQLFVTNSFASAVDVLDISKPAHPIRTRQLDVRPWGPGPTSVSTWERFVAISVPAADRTDPGHVLIFGTDGKLLQTIRVGSNPDMLVFSKDGTRLLVANEGEPSEDYRRDPVGSVSLLTRADRRWDQEITETEFVRVSEFVGRDRSAPPVRIFGPRATLDQDLEPEYIAVAPDGRRAWVTLQENNAIGVLDLDQRRVVGLWNLGSRSFDGNAAGADVSDADQRTNIQSWPVRGLFQPDGIAHFEIDGAAYLITANEGDHRDYPGFTELARVSDLELDPAHFVSAKDLQQAAALGRLQVTTTEGDANHDGRFEELVTFGTRSFAIWSDKGHRVFDSGDLLERMVAKHVPDYANSDGTPETHDTRSDDKGPEPEAVTVGLINGRTLAFLGLERPSAIAVVDVSRPSRPAFLSLYHGSQFPGSSSAQDQAPEGLCLVPAASSPNHRDLLIACFEVSGTTRILEVVRKSDGDASTSRVSQRDTFCQPAGPQWRQSSNSTHSSIFANPP